MVGGFLSYDLPFVLGGTKSGGIVGGAEFRRDAGTARPDQNLIEGNAPGFGSSTPIDALIEVRELYAEAKLPIFDIASIEGGIRQSDYKNRDNLTGDRQRVQGDQLEIRRLTSSLFRDIRLRAVYQRAVRAPNLNEIGQPLTPSTGDLGVDPCQSPTVAVPVGLTPAQYAAAHSGFAGGLVPGNRCSAGKRPGAGPSAAHFRSDQQLRRRQHHADPGKGDDQDVRRRSWAALPHRLHRGDRLLRYQGDNAVFALPEAITVGQCYEVEQSAAGFFCQRILRNPLDGSLIGGTETGVISTNVNAGSLAARGIDFNLNYRTPQLFQDFRLALALNATRTLRSNIQAVKGGEITECVGLVGEECLRPLPKWQWNQTTTAFWGPATIQLRWRHIGKLTQDQIAFGNADASDYAVPTIKAHNYFDLFTKFDVGDHYEFRFGVQNLLDKQPPIVGNDYGGTTEVSGNTIPATYDPLGRSFFAGVNLRF